MDPIAALVEIMTQLQELSGAGLDLVTQLQGGAPPAEGEAPAGPPPEEIPPGS